MRFMGWIVSSKKTSSNSSVDSGFVLWRSKGLAACRSPWPSGLRVEGSIGCRARRGAWRYRGRTCSRSCDSTKCRGVPCRASRAAGSARASPRACSSSSAQ